MSHFDIRGDWSSLLFVTYNSKSLVFTFLIFIQNAPLPLSFLVPPQTFSPSRQTWFVLFFQYLGDIDDIDDNDDNDDDGNHDDNDENHDNDDDDGDGVDIAKHLRLSSSLSRSCLVSCFSTYFEQDDVVK